VESDNRTRKRRKGHEKEEVDVRKIKGRIRRIKGRRDEGWEGIKKSSCSKQQKTIRWKRKRKMGKEKKEEDDNEEEKKTCG
jgi:hypothetical protein